MFNQLNEFQAHRQKGYKMNESYNKSHKNNTENFKSKEASVHMIKKEKFEIPHMEIVTFDAEDVISTSSCPMNCDVVCSTNCKDVCTNECQSVG